MNNTDNLELDLIGKTKSKAKRKYVKKVYTVGAKSVEENIDELIELEIEKRILRKELIRFKDHLNILAKNNAPARIDFSGYIKEGGITNIEYAKKLYYANVRPEIVKDNHLTNYDVESCCEDGKINSKNLWALINRKHGQIALR